MVRVSTYPKLHQTQWIAKFLQARGLGSNPSLIFLIFVMGQAGVRYRGMAATGHSVDFRPHFLGNGGQVGSLNINCPTNYIIMILINMFNDVLRKPLVTLLLGAENAQILSPCKESILKSCSAAYSGPLTRQYISHLVKFYGPERAFHWRNPVPWD